MSPIALITGASGQDGANRTELVLDHGEGSKPGTLFHG